MGIIRLLLALAVVYGHAAGAGIIAPYTPTAGYFPLHAVSAVQMFFVISGFVIALVLDTQYRGPSGTRIFWLNRYLRLMPCYLAVLLLSTVLVSYTWLDLPADSWQALAFKASTLALFGIELTAFYDVGGQGVHALLPIPQAWSLGIELAFYALAPALVRLSTRGLIALTLVLVAARIGLAEAGAPGFPWLQRIAPLELPFFLFGVLAFRAYAASSLKNAPGRHRAAGALAFAAATALALFGGYFGMEAWRPGATLAAALGLAAALPFIFALTGGSALDRRLGDLSYPLYLVHVLVLNAVPGARDSLFAFMALSLAASLPLLLVIEMPLEHLRRRLRRGASGTARASANATGVAAISQTARMPAQRIDKRPA